MCHSFMFEIFEYFMKLNEYSTLFYISIPILPKFNQRIYSYLYLLPSCHFEAVRIYINFKNDYWSNTNLGKLRKYQRPKKKNTNVLG